VTKKEYVCRSPRPRKGDYTTRPKGFQPLRRKVGDETRVQAPGRQNPFRGTEKTLQSTIGHAKREGEYACEPTVPRGKGKKTLEVARLPDLPRKVPRDCSQVPPGGGGVLRISATIRGAGTGKKYRLRKVPERIPKTKFVGKQN